MGRILFPLRLPTLPGTHIREQETAPLVVVGIEPQDALEELRRLVVAIEAPEAERGRYRHPS